MGGEEVGHMATVLSYQNYICQIIISVSALIYALILLSITFFRPWTATRTARILAISTAFTFLAGSGSRMGSLFAVSHPELITYLQVSNILLAVLCSCCACVAWIKLDDIFAVRKPEDIVKSVVSQIKEELEDLDNGSGHVSIAEALEVIDTYSINIRIWIR